MICEIAVNATTLFAVCSMLVLFLACLAALYWADHLIRGKDEELALKLEEITGTAELPVFMALGVIILCWLGQLVRWAVNASPVDRRFRPGWLIAATVMVLYLLFGLLSAFYGAAHLARGINEELALRLEEITDTAELPVCIALGVIVLCWLGQLLRWVVWHSRSPS